MPETLRLFVGSALNDQVAKPLLSLGQQSCWQHCPVRLKWVEPSQLHLTWLFLGAVDAERLAYIQEGLSTALADASLVEAHLNDVVWWPNPRKARLLVCRLEPSPALNQLAQRIRDALPDYPADKPFTPHITLARLKAQRKPYVPPLPLAADLDRSTPWWIDRISLYNSTLTPTGPIYAVRHSVSLQSAAVP